MESISVMWIKVEMCIHYIYHAKSYLMPTLWQVHWNVHDAGAGLVTMSSNAHLPVNYLNFNLFAVRHKLKCPAMWLETQPPQTPTWLYLGALPRGKQGPAASPAPHKTPTCQTYQSFFSLDILFITFQHSRKCYYGLLVPYYFSLQQEGEKSSPRWQLLKCAHICATCGYFFPICLYSNY